LLRLLAPRIVRLTAALRLAGGGSRLSQLTASVLFIVQLSENENMLRMTLIRAGGNIVASRSFAVLPLR